MESFQLSACAKINLGLEILRKRPDGYHDIRSIFVGVDLCDTLDVEDADESACTCIPPMTVQASDNLVVKAMEAYRSAFPSDQRTAKITVTKRIPAGGGLGGGSSDAGHTLVALARLNGRDPFGPDATVLYHVAASIGSDVPFFLNPTVALVEGRGEIITPLPFTLPWTVLLVCPGIHINTALAYSTLGISGGKPGSDMVENLRKCIEDQGRLTDLFHNDFESTVFTQHPVLAVIKQRLLDNQAIYAAMSGSGSTMFGLFTSVENAERARSAFADSTTYICQPIARGRNTP